MVSTRRGTYNDQSSVDGKEVGLSVSGVESNGGKCDQKNRAPPQQPQQGWALAAMVGKRILPSMGYWCGKVMCRGSYNEVQRGGAQGSIRRPKT
jgi:hypothetical protein